jgi:hypothetical protein
VIEEQKCEKCGVTKLTYPDTSVLFRTKWSEINPEVNPMTPAAFNTKCCRFLKGKGEAKKCINDCGEWDSRYDFEIQNARMGLEINEKLNRSEQQGD